MELTVLLLMVRFMLFRVRWIEILLLILGEVYILMLILVIMLLPVMVMVMLIVIVIVSGAVTMGTVMRMLRH